MKDKETRRPEDLRRVIDAHTAFLTPDPLLAQKVARLAKGEETKMKKKLSAGAALVIALLLIGMTAAVAEIIIQYNQNWYFDHRFTSFKDLEPETYQGIKENLTEQVEQTQTENSLVIVTVQDAAFVKDRNLMTFTARVTPKDPEHFELHSMMALDTDGAYVGEGGEENPEDDSVDRAHHWLFVSAPDFSAASVFGPPAQVMDDPGKTLVLFNDGKVEIDGQKVLPAFDTFRVEDGAVILYYEVNLNEVETAEDVYGPFVPRGDTAQVRLAYRAVEYTEGMDDAALYQGGEPGMITFTVNLQ